MAVESGRSGVLTKLPELFQRVTNGRLDVGRLSEDSLIREDLGLSSLELLELRFELETTWNIELSDREAEDLDTVSDVVDLILQKAA